MVNVGTIDAKDSNIFLKLKTPPSKKSRSEINFMKIK